MLARVTCLSPYTLGTVRAMFKGRHEVEITFVPDPPAQPAVLASCREAHLVIGDQRHKHRVDRPVLEQMGSCRLIQMPAVGFDVIDHRAAAEFGIPVANSAGYNRDSVADWTVMATIALLRHSFWGDRAMRAGRWGPGDRMREEMLGHELGAMTVGIIGLGNVGAAVAHRMAAFGPRIIFTDAVPRQSTEAERVDLDTLLRQSDVICVHTPLDVDTKALIDGTALAKMKPGSILINAARGPIVDEQALVQALLSGHLGGAGLDVYETEPLPADSPLRKLDNVVLAPHAGGATFEADARLIEVVGDNLLRVLDGLPPLNVVNGLGMNAK